MKFIENRYRDGVPSLEEIEVDYNDLKIDEYERAELRSKFYGAETWKEDGYTSEEHQKEFLNGTAFWHMVKTTMENKADTSAEVLKSYKNDYDGTPQQVQDYIEKGVIKDEKEYWLEYSMDKNLIGERIKKHIIAVKKYVRASTKYEEVKKIKLQ